MALTQKDPKKKFNGLTDFLPTKDKVKTWIHTIFFDQNFRKIFFFLLLNLSVGFVQLLYSIWTDILSLKLSSVHMLSDSITLLFNLVALIISKWESDEKLSHHYSRVEILAGLFSGLLLSYTALNTFGEAIQRLLEPPEIKDRLFIVPVLGLIVNIVGIFLFQHGHGVSCDHREQTVMSQNSNSKLMKGVFFHILADTMGSINAIISAILINFFGWMRADPICSVIIAILIAISAYNLIKESFCSLTQKQLEKLS